MLARVCVPRTLVKGVGGGDVGDGLVGEGKCISQRLDDVILGGQLGDGRGVHVRLDAADGMEKSW